MLIIKKLRLQKGWSQSELAQFSGLSIRTVQRVEKGGNPGLETLKSLAAVFDLEVADFQQEDGFMNDLSVSEEERKAFEYVRKLKGFYRHVFIYVFCLFGMLILNLITDPGYLWVRWPAFGWGIGVCMHAFKVYSRWNLFGGPEWEKRQVEKRLGRKL